MSSISPKFPASWQPKMRANTRALLSDPRFSVRDFGPKGKWGMLSFSSPREALEASKQHARTENEKIWHGDPKWQGLGAQSLESLDAAGIAEHPLAAIRAANAALPHKQSRPGIIQPSIAGGAWSIPAVLAGLPLAARSRARTKLAPLTINLVCAWSASVSDEKLSPVFAKLGRALNDYTLAGGSVSLFLHYIGFLRAGPIDSIRGAIIRMRAPTADLAQLSLGCSVAAFRAVSGPLITALSDSRRDTIAIPQAIDNPIPASIYLGGRTSTGDIGPSLASTLEALAIR